MDELFPETAAIRRVSLVRLSGEIARAAAAIGRFAVEGEVVRPKITGGGGAFFALRDRASQVTVRCPASRMARCHLAAGERVQVTGTLEYANDRGELRLVADEVVPVGAGAIAALIAEVRDRLERDGLMNRPRRRVPRLPLCIGVVCGTEAAVRADIESVVTARFPGYPVEFLETNVSGPGAVDAVCAAVSYFDGRPDVEVIVLARGGGDPSQLLPFSDETLCRAVASCSTPVVSAIGHEGDRPLCDLVADLRCGTPSLAAAAVVPDHDGLVAELTELRHRAEAGWERAADSARRRLDSVDLDGALRAGFRTAEQRLTRCSDRFDLVHPKRLLEHASDRLDRVDWRTPLFARHDRCRADLAGHARHLEALSPVRVMERGYAVVRTQAGAVVRDAADVAPGDRIEVTFARGRAAAAVEETQP